MPGGRGSCCTPAAFWARLHPARLSFQSFSHGRARALYQLAHVKAPLVEPKRSERGPEKRSALPCSQHRCSQQVRDGGSPCHLTGERIKRGPPTQGKTAAVVQLLSRVRLFVTPWAAAHQASRSITNSQSPSKLLSIDSAMPSNHLILCCPLLLLPSIFPSISVLFQ